MHLSSTLRMGFLIAKHQREALDLYSPAKSMVRPGPVPRRLQIESVRSEPSLLELASHGPKRAGVPLRGVNEIRREIRTARFKGAGRTTRALCVFFVLLAALFNAGCSVRHYAINKLGDALADTGTTFASDDDPELIRGALPFSLKLVESLLAESPRHQGLLLAAASGFTQYSYAFVQQEADEMEARDLREAERLRTRARRLYLRARNYGVRGLEIRRRDFGTSLRQNPKQAVQEASVAEVPLLYWTAASWGAAIAVSKDDPELIADLPVVEALIDRALELDENYDSGAIHGFLITYETGRPGGKGDPSERSRRHFDRALALSSGQLASPFVALAEAVSITKQDRKEFESLLGRALAIQVDQKPEWRLANMVMQRRARWLLSRTDELFLE
jgi:predicted anti-sigma-YlaC factor YlaD